MLHVGRYSSSWAESAASVTMTAATPMSTLRMTFSFVLRHARLNKLSALRNLVQSLRQLDVTAPGILDEGDCDAERGDLCIRAIQLDALRFELLAELLEVLH